MFNMIIDLLSFLFYFIQVLYFYFVKIYVKYKKLRLGS